MLKIVDVKIRITRDDEEYFSERDRFGSTEYAEYMKNQAIGLAMYLEARESIEQSETGALLFGKALHRCLYDPTWFDTVKIGKTQYTTSTGYNNSELGVKDYFLLKNFLAAFPIDLKALKSNSDFFEQEVGYFLDITILDELTRDQHVIKFRCKPDLAFKLPLNSHLYILDWKSTSKFNGGEFAVKYQYQGNLYAHLMYLITGSDSVKHINYIFEKEHPYKQYDLEPYSFNITEDTQRVFLNEAVNMHIIRQNHKDFLKQSAALGSDVLRCFSR